jgi:hypothetical protein
MPQADRKMAEIAASARNLGTRVTEFRANPGGQELFERSLAHEIILSGANSSGKTYCGLIMCAYHLLPEKDQFGNPTGFTIHPYRRIRIPRHGIEGWISCWSEGVQRSNIKPVYDKILEPYETGKKVESGVRKWADFETGRIIFKWQTMGVDAYKGDKENFIHMDEPHKPFLYNEAKARLIARMGTMWTTATFVVDETYTDMQIGDVLWMQEKIIDPWLEDKSKFPLTDVIFLSAEENKGYIDVDFMSKLFANMSIEERTVRLTGRLITHFGECWFDNEKLKRLADYLRTTPGVSVPQYGNLSWDYDSRVEGTEDRWGVRFTEDRQTFPDKPKGEFTIKIWQHPIEKKTAFIRPEYFIGVDAAEGKRGGDYTGVSVVRGDTGEEVAALHGHLSEIELAQQLQLLGRYYETKDGRNAMLAIEVNNIGKAAQSYLINGLPIHGIHQYGIDRLYHRPSAGRMQKGVRILGTEPGWYTSSATREFALTAMRRVILDAYTCLFDPPPDTAPHAKMKDAGHIEEARWFQLSKTGKYEARAGVSHDDRLFARAIAEICRDQYAYKPQHRGDVKEVESTDPYIVRKDGTIEINDEVMFKQPKKEVSVMM